MTIIWYIMSSRFTKEYGILSIDSRIIRQKCRQNFIFPTCEIYGGKLEYFLGREFPGILTGISHTGNSHANPGFVAPDRGGSCPIQPRSRCVFAWQACDLYCRPKEKSSISFLTTVKKCRSVLLFDFYL